jgi:hypothetical protein
MRLKIIFLTTIILLLAYFPSFGQTTYSVTFIEDTVYVNNKILKIHDSFLSTDEMRFQNNNGVLKVCCSPDGKPVNFWGENYNNSKAKTPKEHQNYIVSLGTNRSGENIDISGLKNFLSTPKIGILDTLKIPINNSVFEVNENAFFYVRYKYKGKDINKELISFNDTLLISNYIFELEKTGPIQPDFLPISIYLYNTQNEDSTPLTENFYPIFMDLTLLKNNLWNVINHQNLSSDDKLQIMADYLALEYSDIFFFKDNLSVLIQAE